MQWKFYIGDGWEAEGFILAAEERKNLVYAKRRALMDEYGADGLILSSGFTYGTPIALGFREKQSRPYFKGEARCKDGYYYFPRLTTKAGKELAAKLDDPDVIFDKSDYVIESLGLFHVEHGSMASGGKCRLYQSVGSYGNGLILVKIPYKNDAECEKLLQKIPPWFREVKESEFLAPQGK